MITTTWTPVPSYGFGENSSRVEFWSAKNTAGQLFKDERGVSCFDYPDLVAAIERASAQEQEARDLREQRRDEERDYFGDRAEA